MRHLFFAACAALAGLSADTDPACAAEHDPNRPIHGYRSNGDYLYGTESGGLHDSNGNYYYHSGSGYYGPNGEYGYQSDDTVWFND
jgi:hypothetical protein